MSDDLISRQTAIDSVMKLMPSLTTPDGSGQFDAEIFRMQEMFVDIGHVLNDLPPAQPEKRWIPVTERLPEDLQEVNITWVNTNPESYYESIKCKPFTGSAVYYKGRWNWYSAVCRDYLVEYGFSPNDEIDDAIKVVAWMPLPSPYMRERRSE